MSRIGYYNLACNEYKFFEYTLRLLNDPEMNNPITYNAIAIQAQQIIEKLLKYVLDEHCIEVDNTGVLESHKIRTLARAIDEQIGARFINDDAARFITHNYFECSSPGYDYIMLTREEADQAVSITQQVFKDVTSFRDSKLKKITSFTS